MPIRKGKRLSGLRAAFYGAFMSGKGSKGKGTGSFTVSKKAPKTSGTGSIGSIPAMEPVFEVDLDSPNPSDEPVKFEGTDRSIELAISRLQPEIDSIAKLPKQEDLNQGQVEILRKYISLKETESRDLKEQLRQYQNLVKKITSQLETATTKNKDLLFELESLRTRDEFLKRELQELKVRHESEMQMLKADHQDQLRASGKAENHIQELDRRKEEWKEKIREDLKRIKLKERELENKYELFRRDMQALLDSKDKHVLELKKKNDALELELEGLEDRLRNNNTVLGSIESKKKRLLETLRLASHLLEAIDAVESNDDDSKAA